MLVRISAAMNGPKPAIFLAKKKIIETKLGSRPRLKLGKRARSKKGIKKAQDIVKVRKKNMRISCSCINGLMAGIF